ncbi:MAG: hypothetical protein ACP5XB_10120 [Isosphaeraceae bacterium]
MSRTKRLVFSIVTLILGWLVCETGGYFFYWYWFGHPFSWAQAQKVRRDRVEHADGMSNTVFSEVHPYVGYVETPTSESGVRRTADGRVMPISEYGYIDDKLPFQSRGPDRVVVAILGGSVASYFAVNGARRLEADLAGSPRFADKHFVFVNLALGGYKEPQQLMTLAYLMTLGAQFDLVLNIDGFNEVALHELENASHHIFPAFPRSWYAKVGSTDPTLGLTRGKLLVLDEERTNLARWHSRAPWRYSVLCNIVWNVRARWLEWESYRLREQHFQTENRAGPYVVTGPRKEFASREALYEHLAEIWMNSSILLNRLCSNNGMRYYHFLQPNQYFPGSKPMGEEEKKVAIWPGHPYRQGVELGYPLLLRGRRRLKEQGVRFVDLTGIYKDHPEPIYVDSCCHFNQLGLDLMADAIARAILGDQATRTGK